MCKTKKVNMLEKGKENKLKGTHLYSLISLFISDINIISGIMT